MLFLLREQQLAMECDIKSTMIFEEDDEDIKDIPDGISQRKCDVCGFKTKEEHFEHSESKIVHHIIVTKVSLRSSFEKPFFKKLHFSDQKTMQLLRTRVIS